MNYKYIKEINSQEELEKYRIDKEKVVWTSDIDNFNEYNIVKQKAINNFMKTCGIFGLKESFISEKDVYLNPLLKESRDKELKKPSIFQKWNEVRISERLFGKKYTNLSSEDKKELSSFISKLSKISSSISSQNKFDFYDDIEPVIDDVYSKLANFNDLTEEESYHLNNKLNIYMLKDSILLKNDYNFYEKKTTSLYTNFFENQKIQNIYEYQISEENPMDYLLKINCDINLPKGSVFDVYGSLDAKNIKCGFLGVQGNLKAKDINVNKAWAYNLQCEDINKIHDGVEYESIFNELTIENEVFSSSEEYDYLIESGYFSDNIKNDIIVGMFVEDEVASNLDGIIMEDSEYAKTYSIGEKNGKPIYFNPNLKFIGGTLNAHKTEVDGIFCGEAKVDYLFCNSLIAANSVIDTEKTLEKNTLFKHSIGYFNNIDYYTISPTWKLQCGDVETSVLHAQNIKCNNLSSDNLFTYKAEVINSICSEVINAKDIQAKNIKCQKIFADDIITDNLELDSNFNFNISNSNNTKIENIYCHDEDFQNFPGLQKYCSNINIIKNQNDNTKARPKTSVINNIESDIKLDK